MVMTRLFDADFPDALAGVAAKAEVEEHGFVASKLQVRMAAKVEDARRLVGHFATNLWDQVKESQFTTPVNKLS
jgi:hypothetical protein